MTKRILLLLGLHIVPLLAFMIGFQSCGKDTVYYQYSYVIVQPTVWGQPVTDTTSAISGDVGMRIWIGKERYYDRFATLFAPNTAYAASIDDSVSYLANNEYQEKSDKLTDIEVYLITQSKDKSTWQNLDRQVQFQVEGSSSWQDVDGAISTFNDFENQNENPRYIDVRFDKFTTIGDKYKKSFQAYVKTEKNSFWLTNYPRFRNIKL